MSGENTSCTRRSNIEFGFHKIAGDDVKSGLIVMFGEIARVKANLHRDRLDQHRSYSRDHMAQHRGLGVGLSRTSMARFSVLGPDSSPSQGHPVDVMLE